MEARVFPGKMVVKYIEVPVASSTTSGQIVSAATSSARGSNGLDTPTVVGVVGAILVAVALGLRFLKGRGSGSRRSSERISKTSILDDVDRRVVEALRRYG